jgi:hypothetical protein
LRRDLPFSETATVMMSPNFRGVLVRDLGSSDDSPLLPAGGAVKRKNSRDGVAAMRPVSEVVHFRAPAARCHLGLGSLYRRAGKTHEAREHLATAAALFRHMRMGLWSERVDAELTCL